MTTSMTASMTPSMVRVQKVALATGLAGLAVLAVGVALAPARALSNLLVGGYLVLGLSVGGVVLLSLLAVANAGWAVVLKRIFEAFGAFVPVAALLLIWRPSQAWACFTSGRARRRAATSCWPERPPS